MELPSRHKPRNLPNLDQTRPAELNCPPPPQCCIQPSRAVVSIDLQVAAVALNHTAMMVSFEVDFLISGCP